MTEQIKSRKWLSVLFFCSLGLFFSYFVYFIATEATDPVYNQRLEKIRKYRKPMLQPDGDLILARDHWETFEGLKITYRGMEAEMIIIDFVIMDLDRDYTYHHRITAGEAKHGFNLSDSRFMMESVNTLELRLAPGPGRAYP